jgi:hypothetical protein
MQEVKGLARDGARWPSGARYASQPDGPGSGRTRNKMREKLNAIPVRVWQILVGIVWVVGTVLACKIGFEALTWLPVYLWNDCGWRWSDDTDKLVDSGLDFMSSVGTLIITGAKANAVATRNRHHFQCRRSRRNVHHSSSSSGAGNAFETAGDGTAACGGARVSG